ncbi:MAG: Gfo/Idh/MocA family oxidoreductase [Clostridiales bacterium]|nr:Gfo/Idh/MocA family oxidoreductase [Clostridiales bacterium]
MNILLVGLGGMGTCHYMNYLEIEGANVAACVGRTDSDQASAAKWNLPIYESIAEACTTHEIDVIDVCAPTYLHKALVLEAAKQKKHIICEKPVALNLRDAKEMYAAAEENGVQLYIAQVLQFTREVETLREVIADKRYGKPLDGCFERLTACPKWSQGGWLLDKEKSGLLPFDLHIHDLDVIVSMFGKPDDVIFTECAGEGKAYAEQYRFQYIYHNGLNVSAEAAWFNAAIPFTARWRVYFERGMLICDHNGVTGYAADGTVTEFDITDPVIVDCGINLGASGWFYRELSHLLDCAGRGVPSPLVPRQRVLDVVEILEKI